MRRRFDNQLALDLTLAKRRLLPGAAPEGLLQALADLLLEALGLYFSGEYEAAVAAAKRAIRSNPNYPGPYRWLAAALGQLGRTAEAQEALEEAIATAPASVDIFIRGRVPWMRPADHAHMLEGLRKAGWKD